MVSEYYTVRVPIRKDFDLFCKVPIITIGFALQPAFNIYFVSS